MKDFKLKIKNDFAGFTLVEIIIAIGMSSLLTGLMLPSFLNLIRTEKVNSYTRELKEFFRVVKLDSRRWGSSCQVNINSCLLYTSPSPRDRQKSRMPSSA